MGRAAALLFAVALGAPHIAGAQTGSGLPATGLEVCDEFLLSYLACIRQARKGTERITARAREMEVDMRDPATRTVYENICALGLSVARNIQAQGGCARDLPM